MHNLMDRGYLFESNKELWYILSYCPEKWMSMRWEQYMSTANPVHMSFPTPCPGGPVWLVLQVIYASNLCTIETLKLVIRTWILLWMNEGINTLSKSILPRRRRHTVILGALPFREGSRTVNSLESWLLYDVK